ncbi:MAG: AAA family ATPase [Natronospirillum sp.]
MYEGFFGLNNPPFSLTPDTQRFVNLDSHRTCFDLLTFGIESNEGFVKIVGDVGTGKTMLCRKLLHYLEEPSQRSRFRPIYIPNPMLSALGLLRAIAHKLNIKNSGELRYADLFEGIQARLLEEAAANRNAVIIIDEAQALPADTLEALRLITNLETERKKLVQIVLFGQQELNVILSQHRFRQLSHRITFGGELKPMPADTVGHYVNGRMSASGYNGAPIFSGAAARLLYRYSRGSPRVLNILCHKALLSAYGRGRRQVQPADIRRAAAETPRSRTLPRHNWLAWGLIPLGMLALVTTAMNQWGWPL